MGWNTKLGPEPIVESGDLILTHGTSTIGKMIRWAERVRGELPSWTNHSGMFVHGGPITQAEAVESLWRTVCHPWWENHIGDQASVFRPPIALEEQRAAILKKMWGYVGDRYGWWKLLLHLPDNKLFRGRNVLRRLQFVDGRPICSYSTAHAYQEGGVVFRNVDTWLPMDPDDVQPDDQEDYCLDSRSGWRCLVHRVTVQ